MIFLRRGKIGSGRENSLDVRAQARYAALQHGSNFIQERQATMNAAVTERVGKVYRNRFNLLMSFQELGKEVCWDYVSQQMEASEDLAHLMRNQVGNMLKVAVPNQAVATMGLGAVSVGRAMLGHAVAATKITRHAEREAWEIMVNHMSECFLAGWPAARGEGRWH
ncbi:MAG: hypothetical protein HQL73_04855 [Magnetococcales bacterium]|nr:hypothetical protein [Magnetococcales bacterium]